MSLRNKTRGELEAVRPFVVDTTEDALLMRCLDDFYIWGLKSDVSVTPSLLNHGFWETWITSWFTRHIKEGDFVVDVGANCGYYTMLFDRLVGPGGRVLAYECNPTYVGLLAMTHHSNNANFIVEPIALSDKAGTVDLTYPGEYTGSASIVGAFDPKWGDPHTIKVPAYTLDEEFDTSMDSPQFIKIDAEGAEELILKGGKELLSRHDAPVLVLEYTPNSYTDGFNEWLFEYGYVTRIGFDGNEEPCSIAHLQGLNDWDMLVIRKK